MVEPPSAKKRLRNEWIPVLVVAAIAAVIAIFIISGQVGGDGGSTGGMQHGAPPMPIALTPS